MNLPTKSNVLQTYQVMLYNRALHPDLFSLKGRRVVKHGDYELECWVLPGTHMLRFEYKTVCVSELLVDQDRPNVGAGVVASFLCAGEHDFEHKFPKDRVNYIATVQTETLSDNLYNSTFDELAEWAKNNRALAHMWNDDAGRCLSLIDVQAQRTQVHAQTYHMVASAGLVLRTQTIFEHY
jgi:hypothetical protein